MPDTIFLQPLTPKQDPEKYNRLEFLRLLTIPRWKGEITDSDYPNLDVGREINSGRVCRKGDWYKTSEAGHLVLASLEIMFGEYEPDPQHYNIYAD